MHSRRNQRSPFKGPCALVILACLLFQGSSGFDLTDWLGFDLTDIFYSGSSNESQVSKDQVSTKTWESSTKSLEQNEMSPIIYLPVNQNEGYTNRYSNAYKNEMSNNQWSSSYQNELSKIKWSSNRPTEASKMSLDQLSPFEKVSEIKWSPNGAQISRYEISPLTVGEITTEVVQIPFRDISKSDLSSIELSKGEVSPERQDITISPISYVVLAILVLGGLALATYFFHNLDIYTTAKIDEFLYDYYGPQMYDRYTTRYDPYSDLNSINSMNNSPLKLKATTANQYYGFAKGFGHTGIVDSMTSRIMSLISIAQELYNQ